jgi:hypothetical protein
MSAGFTFTELKCMECRGGQQEVLEKSFGRKCSEEEYIRYPYLGIEIDAQFIPDIFPDIFIEVDYFYHKIERFTYPTTNILMRFSLR